MIGWLMVSLAALATAQGVTAARPASDASVRAALDGYVRLAARAYRQSHSDAESLQVAVHGMLAQPSERSLARAREAWIACRDSYGRTEVFRFSGGPIDDRHPITGVEGPEGRINTWPIDEAFLDYVAGSPRSGLIGDLEAPLSNALLVGRNVAEDENQVTLGYHAIEFLLWGQDRRRNGPGQRPFSDYLPGDPVRERRRRCLSLITERLVQDLATQPPPRSREPLRPRTARQLGRGQQSRPRPVAAPRHHQPMAPSPAASRGRRLPPPTR